MIRCVETGYIVMKEFAFEGKLLVEEGLAETACEAWFRQWAVPGANTKWGGPPGAAMKSTAALSSTVQGPQVLSGLRPEADTGLRALLRTAQDLAAIGGPLPEKVDAAHVSFASFRNTAYEWGSFETDSEMRQRILKTINARVAAHPGKTLVFVSHGGPTTKAFEALSGEKSVMGGMTALSILRRKPQTEEEGIVDGLWEALVKNDASHAEAMH